MPRRVPGALRPVAALTRVLPGERSRSGLRAGYCVDLSDEAKAGFAGGDEAVRSRVLAAADSDAPGLRAELASLATLNAGASSAR